MNITDKMQVKYYNGIAGEYLCRCQTCTQHFVGDKRDFYCPECSEKALVNRVAVIERELAEARAAIALAREAMAAWLDFGDVHESDCPCDDTCDCKIAAMVNKALSPTIGSDIIAENRRLREALGRFVAHFEPDDIAHLKTKHNGSSAGEMCCGDVVNAISVLSAK